MLAFVASILVTILIVAAVAAIMTARLLRPEDDR